MPARVPLVLLFVSLLLGPPIGVAACTPGSGAVRLEARRGSVTDADSGAPIVGASVYQVYWGRGVAGEPRPVYLLRERDSGSRGEFAFEESVSTEPRSWLFETDAAEYAFFHPDYGLVRRGRAKAPKGEPLRLAARRLDAAQQRASRIEICGSRPPDELVADVARSHCSR